MVQVLRSSYFRANFLTVRPNATNDMALESLKKCETFLYILFLIIIYSFKSNWKMAKTYFWHSLYILYRNGANNIPLKSYGKCETFSCWWFSLIPSRFQVIAKMARSFVLPLSRNWFFKNAPRWRTWTSRHVYLNFSLFFHVLFLLVALHPLLVTLHPLTGIEQVIYRWKAAVNTQLSCVDHFFILPMILKVFHLKFIQHSSWTSCCFHVEFLWRIFVCTRA